MLEYTWKITFLEPRLKWTCSLGLLAASHARKSSSPAVYRYIRLQTLKKRSRLEDCYDHPGGEGVGEGGLYVFVNCFFENSPETISGMKSGHISGDKSSEWRFKHSDATVSMV